MRQRVLFRVDSGAALGAGHLVRCLALAQQFAEEGAQVAFVCRPLPGALLDLPKQANYVVHVLPDSVQMLEDDAHETARFAKQWQATLLVVDHYGLDARWEGVLQETVGGVLAIDDLANRPHVCQWLLDQNDCRPESGRYVPWVPADARLLLGPRFALLRPEFRAARSRCAPRNGQLQRLVVFFSGSDESNETAKALHGLVLLGPPPWQVDVVIGAAHPDTAGIAALCAQNGWQLHCQVPYMADLLATADLSLGSAGSASWERCVLGVPALVVELAENQREVIHALQQHGCVKVLGESWQLAPQHYAEVLQALRSDELATMSLAAWGWIDADGARRVVQSVLETMNEP